MKKLILIWAFLALSCSLKAQSQENYLYLESNKMIIGTFLDNGNYKFNDKKSTKVNVGLNSMLVFTSDLISIRIEEKTTEIDCNWTSTEELNNQNSIMLYEYEMTSNKKTIKGIGSPISEIALTLDKEAFNFFVEQSRTSRTIKIKIYDMEGIIECNLNIDTKGFTDLFTKHKNNLKKLAN